MALGWKHGIAIRGSGDGGVSRDEADRFAGEVRRGQKFVKTE